jgi:hypothetical protein
MATAAAISSKFTALLSVDQINKVIQVANNLKINPNWLLAVMYFETAQTFSTSIRNSIGSVGLIQFTRDKSGVSYKTIGGKQYLLDDIARMSFDTQMDLVEKYYKEAKGTKGINSFIDCYLVTFFPAALGKADNFVFETANLSASIIAKQNPIFDADKNGQIVKAEVTSYFRELYNKWGFNFDDEINYTVALKGKFPYFILGVFFYSVVAFII